MARLDDGRWRCNNCGKIVDGVPPDKAPRVVLASATGKPTMRRLLVDGLVVHACEALVASG